MAGPTTTAEPAWREHYPFASHWLALPEGRLHYLDERPTGPAADSTLLFVHGNPTWSFHWREAVARFCGTHRCVAVDHLGCGLSDKPPRRFRLQDRIDHLVRLIDELELRNVTLVAQDWGGAIGLGAMLERADRLSRIVLLNTGAFPPPFVPWRINVCRTPLLGKLALQGLNLFSRAALSMTVERSALQNTVRDAYLAPYNNWSNRRAVYEFVADIPTNKKYPTWATLARIETSLASLTDRPTRPVLLIWGMRDWCFTPECLRRFQAAWPNAESLELADAGHWVMEDATDEVLDAMAGFLAKAPAAAEASS